MTSKLLTKAVALASAASVAAWALPLSTAFAQDYPPPPPPGYDQGPYGYDQAPPPGYDAQEPTPEQRAADHRYAEYAEQWEESNCVRSHGNVGAGAVIGGVLGAIVGSAAAGHDDRGAGVVAGAAIGGTAGAAIAASSGGTETSPGCPPGYVVRRDAPAFYYGSSYYYAAPPSYQPWVWWEGRWVFRPYPYHVWYYQHYGRDHDDWGDGDHWRDHDRGDWRDGDHRDWRGDDHDRGDWHGRDHDRGDWHGGDHDHGDGHDHDGGDQR